jgi:hypothetical protein
MIIPKHNPVYHAKLPKLIIRIKNFLSQKRYFTTLSFFIIGMLSTIWFLVRVIPKPSRAEYPCMKAAYPLMSGFVVYLLGLAASVFAFRKSRKLFCRSKYFAAAVFLFISFTAVIFSISGDDPAPVYANSKLLLDANKPIGVPKGVNPGRVIWVWDPNSTADFMPVDEKGFPVFGSAYFQDNYTNIDVVNSMMADAVKKLADKNTVAESWNAFFKYFNKNHGKGNIGYTDGEKIFIKTNAVSASSGTYDNATFEIKSQSRYGIAETTPQVVLAVLRQLVNECGIKQENISLGDPMKHMYKHFYDMLHNEFPNVIYIDSDARLGRTNPVSTKSAVVYYSDRGTVLKEGGTTGNAFTADQLPDVITNANYLVVIPAMKAHSRAGVSLCGKIHFGSNLIGSATHLHGGLIAPNNTVSKPDTLRRGYGSYRTQVDLMGHKDLGGKTLLWIIDGLWAGSESNDPPRKFLMAPFNNDWTSSLFVSQDQVALESVCFDFLKAEFTLARHPASGSIQALTYPQIAGSDDHILQAADSTYWPKGIIYDPENDGTHLHSLGVCEHWNNEIDKQYTRNLKTGDGIELVWINRKQTAVENKELINTKFILEQNYPNPFNPTTVISYSIPKGSHVRINIYDITGRLITTLVDEYKEKGVYNTQFSFSTQSMSKGHQLTSGVYFYKLTAGDFSQTKKMILMK